MTLAEISLSLSETPLSDTARQFVAEGRSRFRTVSCFDFVPSDYELVWRILTSLPRGRFCEWGSGWGIVTGLAELLGFQAVGVELDPELVEQSRRLLHDFGLSCPILHADYLDSEQQADVYFVYCWPGSVVRTEDHFQRIAPPHAHLLIANGQSDIRCKARPPLSVS